MTIADKLAEALENMLGSAVPNYRDNPSMAKAWDVGLDAITAYRAAIVSAQTGTSTDGNIG